MSGPEAGLAVSVFLACAVEAVEALTIVLAVGITRSWRSALTGVAGAMGLLALMIAGLGPALTALPINVLRVAVGGLLLIFGLQWLRKAILRACGLKSLRDEREVYARALASAQAAGAIRTRLDAYSFAIAFKGVFLEGLEVVFIVLAFGSNQHRVPLAAAAAAAAVLIVVIVGAAAHAPLARVPENTMKFAVGVMLASFGIFWGAEGAGVRWPGGDAALLAIIPATLGMGLTSSLILRLRGAPGPPRDIPERTGGQRASKTNAFVGLLYELIVGEDWVIAIGVALAVALTALADRVDLVAWWILPIAVASLLAHSVWRAAAHGRR